MEVRGEGQRDPPGDGGVILCTSAIFCHPANAEGGRQLFAGDFK